VPAGASTGKAEAHELRDADPRRYGGLGVLKAVANVNLEIAPLLRGHNPADQFAIDEALCQLDGTPDKARLGANALLGVSLASAHAAAAGQHLPLYRWMHELWRRVHDDKGVDGTIAGCRMPLPMTNMISGGLHAGGNLDFQDFLIMPLGAPSYAVGLEWIVRVARQLSRLLSEDGYEGRLVADEGGYGPRLPSNRDALVYLVRAIEVARLSAGQDVTIALDVASTHFFDGEHYRLRATGDDCLTSAEMIDRLQSLIEEFPITSIEDGLAEDDWPGWQELTTRLGERVRLVGDDLFATNSTRVRRGIDEGVANSVLIKVNQIGTLTETLRTMRLAASAGYTRVVSARSGETEDSTIADLAAGTGADLIKIGSIQRGERLAKYNRLLRIEEDLGPGHHW
jgi:enolase